MPVAVPSSKLNGDHLQLHIHRDEFVFQSPANSITKVNVR
jgi:hypothetical protein